jgi:copper(I)-binding protein
MQMDGNIMKMRALPRLDLPAGKTVRLDSSSSYHVMLMDLKQLLKKGDTVTLSLKIEHKGKKVETVKVKAAVRDLGEADSPVPVADETMHHHH